jgi:hypothetical protein
MGIFWITNGLSDYFDAFFSWRTYDRPRFSSEVRSVLSVAACTGLPDSFPSYAFSSSGVVST